LTTRNLKELQAYKKSTQKTTKKNRKLQELMNLQKKTTKPENTTIHKKTTTKTHTNK